MGEALVTNDLFSDPLWISGGNPDRPRIVITLIPIDYWVRDLAAVTHTLDAAHENSTIRVPVKGRGSSFKIVVEGPGFHEEYYRYLAAGGEYCYTQLFDCTYIQVDSLVEMYRVNRSVVSRCVIH